MSTYLQLCQQMHRLVRAGNNTPGSQPTTVIGQSDPLLLDIIYFVNEAWTQIQQDSQYWKWMRKKTTLTLPINTSTGQNQQLALATIVGVAADWQSVQQNQAGRYPYAMIQDPGQTGQNAPTQMPSYFVPWLEFDGFLNQLPRTPGVPLRWSEDPQYNLWFDAPPLAAPSGSAWTFTVPYRTVPQQLVADATVPLMLPMYHDLIVWWATWMWCQTRGLQSTLNDAATQHMSRILSKLRADQIPPWVLGDRYA